MTKNQWLKLREQTNDADEGVNAHSSTRQCKSWKTLYYSNQRSDRFDSAYYGGLRGNVKGFLNKVPLWRAFRCIVPGQKAVEVAWLFDSIILNPEKYKSFRIICIPGYVLFGFYKDAYLFYTGRKYIKIVQSPDEINHFFNSEERRYLIIKLNELNDIQRWIKAPIYMLLSDSIGHRKIVFVSNKMKD